MAKGQDIKEHMEVIGSNGEHCVITIGWIGHVDAHVYLNKSCKGAVAGSGLICAFVHRMPSARSMASTSSGA